MPTYTLVLADPPPPALLDRYDCDTEDGVYHLLVDTTVRGPRRQLAEAFTRVLATRAEVNHRRADGADS